MSLEHHTGRSVSPYLDEEESEEKTKGYVETVPPIDIISLYLNEASKAPLLTRSQEADLSARVLAKGSDSKEAWDHFTRANTLLVVSIAAKFIDSGMPFLDLVQEGNLGLMKAVNKFDGKRGYRFSTYAFRVIRDAILRSIANKKKTIRNPVKVEEKISKMMHVIEKLEQNLEREPYPEEIANAMNVTVERIETLLEVIPGTLSLESLVYEDLNGSVFGDFLESSENTRPDETYEAIELRELLTEAMNILTPKQAEILKLRYGLLDGIEYTFEEIGLKYGVSGTAVGQVAARALGKLRELSLQTSLRDYASNE
ncbi:MAG: sigma-70 family RNA polymerase sigma factor [Candidatus Woesebacteria bacterium]